MERVGLIAGNGRFPLIFARQARRLGVDVVAVAHEGETDPALAEVVDALTWVKVGELGRIIDTFRDSGVQRAVMAGGIRKSTLFQHFAPDERGMTFLSRLTSLGDDTLLRGVAEELERDGIAVVESTLFLESLLTPAGVLTAAAPSAEMWKDIALGMAVAKAVGQWDVGQTVVLKGGIILAVEAIEGTDAAIRRGAGIGNRDVVVVKVSKPGQDLRFDVPAIGPDTISLCAEVGVRVLALEAGRTLLLEKDEILTGAAAAGVVVVGLDPEARS